MMTRRGLIACAAGLVVARTAHAGLIVTPPQTAGPFYPNTKPLDSDADLTRMKGASGDALGEVIEVRGRILSVKGHALKDAIVEIWQADSHGRYAHPGDINPLTSRDENFQGYGAVKIGTDGAYRFRTIRPSGYSSGSIRRTPHIHFRVVDHVHRELVTQMYFPGEPFNFKDFLFLNLPGETAREAATARLGVGDGIQKLNFDIVLG
jgi:protocatechuate 3,4-dioxygenase beta subunit